MSISLRVSEKEKAVIKEFAELYGMTVSEYIRSVVLEKIEDEYDIKCADEAYEEYLKDPTTYSHEEVAKMLGLK